MRRALLACIALRFLAATALASATAPRWFAPLVEFGPLEERMPPPASLPLLLVLPGLDGSGITAMSQYPELSLDYEVRAMATPPNDRSSYDELVTMVSTEARAAAASREVFVMGESMGVAMALDAARAQPDEIAGLLLVSPATSWESETWLGRARSRLIELPDPLLALVIALTSYQLLDLEQIATTARRIVTGERAPLLATPTRVQYAWRVVRSMPARLSAPAPTIRHRLAEWVPSVVAAGRRLAEVSTPMLVVAGTADARVPAEVEAERYAAEAPLCEVVRVVGAGHAGATDDRIDLRLELEQWRERRRLGLTGLRSPSSREL